MRKLQIAIILLSTLLLISCSDKAEKHYKTAKKNLEAEQYSEAIAQYEAAISEKPDYTKAKYRLAKLFMKLEKYDEAIEYFNSTLKDDPSKAYCYRYLAVIYEKKGEKEAALAVCERGIGRIDDIKVVDFLRALSKKLLTEIEKQQEENAAEEAAETAAEDKIKSLETETENISEQ